MKFKDYLNESNYNNWIFPDKKTIEDDFKEYSKKENSKWKSRANSMGFEFPIFKDINDFTNKLKNGKIIEIKGDISNKVHNMTNISSIEGLKDMVGSYFKPRDVDRILNGFKNNDKIPYGIILKGKNGYFIMAGNTRQNTARILNIVPKMILIDVSKDEGNEI